MVDSSRLMINVTVRATAPVGEGRATAKMGRSRVLGQRVSTTCWPHGCRGPLGLAFEVHAGRGRLDDPLEPLLEGLLHEHEPKSLHGLARHYLGDMVYGANDGIITTFAVVAGVSGASLPARTVLILGFANLLADGFSMGASNVLSIRSGQDIRTADGLDVDEPYAARHGAATFFAFVLAGAIPLAAYLLPGLGAERFPAATALTFVALFVVGALRSLVTRAGWLKSGVEMLLLGAIASALAYGVGAFVAGLT